MGITRRRDGKMGMCVYHWKEKGCAFFVLSILQWLCMVEGSNLSIAQNGGIELTGDGGSGKRINYSGEKLPDERKSYALLDNIDFLIFNEPVIDNGAVFPLLQSLREHASIQEEKIHLLDEHNGGEKEMQLSRGYWSLAPWLLRIHKENASQKNGWYFLATAQTRINFDHLEALLEEVRVGLERESKKNEQNTAKNDKNSQKKVDENAEQNGEKKGENGEKKGENGEKKGENRKQKDERNGENGATSSEVSMNYSIMGFRLVDDGPKITHHYFVREDFGYPLISSGVLISSSVVTALEETLKAKPYAPAISVDPFHDFFRDVYTRLGVSVKNVSEAFCMFGEKSTCAAYTRGEVSGSDRSSVSWYEEKQRIGDALVIMVKTTETHHDTRVKELQRLWANYQNLNAAFLENLDHWREAPSEVQEYIEKRNREIAQMDKSKIEIIFASDKEDPTVPTINLGVGNTTAGHCVKFHKIMEVFLREKGDKSLLLVVDDDTLLNVRNLLSYLVFLARNPQNISSQSGNWGLDLGEFFSDTSGNPLEYKSLKISKEESYEYVIPSARSLGAENVRRISRPSTKNTQREISPSIISPLYLGERYGYAHWAMPHGYDFLTGGCGILFDRKTVQLLFNAQVKCNRREEPDDMAVGRWTHRLGIRPVHLSSFHQATNKDYHELYLQTQKTSLPPISYHRLHKQMDQHENNQMFKFFHDEL